MREVWHAGLAGARRGRGRGGSVSARAGLARVQLSPDASHAEITSRNWKPDWDAFPWRGDNPDAERWRRGMTGEPFVDAAMREMYVTGTMHNRARMIVASYLTKHLMTALAGGAGLVRRLPDRLGPGGECDGLAMGCGLGAGCGALFPRVQSGGSGREVRCRRASIATASWPSCARSGTEALDFFEAVPRSWGLAPGQAYPRRSSIWPRGGRGPLRPMRHESLSDGTDFGETVGSDRTRLGVGRWTC
jgi:deoxyribodipyrimidine photo-lyase